ncbi:MAG: tetratricopeptide repeat protein [Ignavibacteriaceae bacterium]
MKKYLFLVILPLLIISCSKTSDQEYFDQANNFLKEKKYKDVIKTLETLINEYPDSKLAPKALVQTAVLYESKLIEGVAGLNSYTKAAETYFQVYEKYPESEEAPIALFQCGFLYDNEMKNYDEATKKYNLFLEKYPDHKYAKIVQQSLDIMGLDPNDIINKKESAKN